MPGGEVRLRGDGIVRCDEVIKDQSGAIVELRGTLDPQSRPGLPGADRKIKGTLHWLSARDAIAAEIRLYDRLFSVADPDNDEDGKTYRDYLNPDSRRSVRGYVEPAAADATPEQSLQFERWVFCRRPPRPPSRRSVFNRSVTLRDTGNRKELELNTRILRAVAAVLLSVTWLRAPHPQPVAGGRRQHCDSRRFLARQRPPQLPIGKRAPHRCRRASRCARAPAAAVAIDRVAGPMPLRDQGRRQLLRRHAAASTRTVSGSGRGESAMRETRNGFGMWIRGDQGLQLQQRSMRRRSSAGGRLDRERSAAAHAGALMAAATPFPAQVHLTLPLWAYDTFDGALPYPGDGDKVALAIELSRLNVRSGQRRAHLRRWCSAPTTASSRSASIACCRTIVRWRMPRTWPICSRSNACNVRG